MNLLLTLGVLLIVGYLAGWLFSKVGLPKIIGYILTGILFSPNSSKLIEPNLIELTRPLMEVCLGIITFEVGGALKWSRLKKHTKEIFSITILASLVPYLLIVGGLLLITKLFPGIIQIPADNLIPLALILGALASPTEPAATLSVIRQYKAKGKVTDTILGVAALDDMLGILIFSLTISGILIAVSDGTQSSPALLVNSVYQIGGAIVVGAVIGFSFNLFSIKNSIEGEGQWVVIILSLIILGIGLTKFLKVDILLSSMTAGVVVANFCTKQSIIFRILQRYTEELIFLFFFILSGLHLDISTIPVAASLIWIFIIFRTSGKYIGTNIASRFVNADASIRKYTAGGLLPQGGIVFGLILSIYENEIFHNISNVLITTLMGTMIIHEFIGPIVAKISLKNAGELGEKKH